MASMCDTCHAGCCRSYHIFITAFDAFSLSRDLGLPVGEFVTLLSFTTETVQRYTEDYVPIRFSGAPDADALRFILALKKVPSLLFPGTNKCYFLSEWERDKPVAGREGHLGRTHIGRCGVYASRPMICRTFPSILHSENGLGFISKPRPVDLGHSDQVHAICPEEWTVENFGVEATTALHQLAISEYERRFYNQAVTEFNGGTHTVNDFFPFMARVYRHRMRNAPGVGGVPLDNRH